MAQSEAVLLFKGHPPKNSGKDLAQEESKRNAKA